MSAANLLPPAPSVGHLTPHDLVTFSRCPLEMELVHHRREVPTPPPNAASVLRTPHVLRQSPLFPPPTAGVRVVDGRMDVGPHDVLVYADEEEDDLPMLFPPERVRLDPALLRHGGNLLDDVLGLSGRPDFVIRRPDGSLYPVEYKETHLFHRWTAGHFEAHGRNFDAIQAIAECRLVEATSGVRPPFGVVLYGDRGEDGEHEGFVEIPYTDREAGWLRAAVKQIRADPERPAVPSEGHCGHCEANAAHLCAVAAVPYARTTLQR